LPKHRRAHGEGTIYQRADGRWEAALRLPGGRRISRYGKTQREAQERLLEARTALRDGVLAIGPTQSVEAYLDSWLENTAGPRVRPRTRDSYGLNIRRISRHIGEHRLATLSPSSVQRCYGKLLSEGLSARSVEQTHSVLHAALKDAVRLGLIFRNPADAVSAPRPKKRQMETFSASQLLDLFADDDPENLTCLWVLLGTTALRLGEALGLSWEAVDLETGRIHVQRALQRQNGRGLVMVEPKSDSSRRTVHLTDLALTRLASHRREQIERYLRVGLSWDPHGLVFTGPLGDPIEPTRAGRAFGKALRRAGLPRRRIHDLRHTVATLLFKDGAHPKMVQALLGHSTISLTLDTYSHVIPSMHAETAVRMESLLSAADGQTDG
jgi:integrase